MSQSFQKEEESQESKVDESLSENSREGAYC
jgi:hypothetical protein